MRVLKNATAVVLSRTETESRLDRRTATGEWAFGSVKTRALYFTSAAVTGLPSCHRARGSIENAIDSESGAHVQLFASCGVNPLSPTVERPGLICARRSKTRSRTTAPFCSLTNGGKMSVASPGMLTITVPPVGELELVPRSVPHAMVIAAIGRIRLSPFMGAVRRRWAKE